MARQRRRRSRVSRRRQAAQAAVTIELQGAGAAGENTVDGALAQAREDYEEALRERDKRTAALEGEIAEAAKTAESAERLRAEMDELRRQGEEQRVGFELQMARARNVKAARALLADHDNDIDKLKEAEPWLFGAGTGAPARAGATGLPNAATDEGATMRRWRGIAGLPDEKEQRIMANSIAYVKNYTAVLDEVYRRAVCSTRRMARAGRNTKEITVTKIEVSGLGDYTRNAGYKTGSITYEFETKTFNYDRGIRPLADVMGVEEARVLDYFVAAESELQRTQVAPEADAFTFSEIAGHEGVAPPPRTSRTKKRRWQPVLVISCKRGRIGA